MMMNVTKNQKGLAAVEFAIVLPVMLFLMLATAEMGRAFYQYNTLTKAVQAGARYASKPLLSASDLASLDPVFKQRIQHFIVFGNENGAGGTAILNGLNATDSAVTISSSVANRTITIEVQYDYPFSILGDIQLFGLNLPTLTLKASVVTGTSLTGTP